MLLIFFLVTSSMDTDKGLLRQMPPPQEEHRPLNISKDHVLEIRLAADGSITSGDDLLTPQQLTQRVCDLARRDRSEHVISLDVDPAAAYGDYFNMQNAIVAAYNSLRNEEAMRRFKKKYQRCTTEEKSEVAQYYPQRISEKGGSR